MSNLLTDSVDLHIATLQDTGGEEVTYHRGSSSVSLTAVRGNSDFDEQVGDAEATVQMKTIDFLVKRSDLVIGGEIISPVRGDYIKDGDERKYNVLPAIAGAASDYNDGRKQMIRVHTIEDE